LESINNKLTEEQKKLIEDNLPFMYWWFERHHIYNEDTQQDLLYNFCALIHLYDLERGAITTFIDVLNRSKIGKLWKRDNQRQAFEKFAVCLDDYVFSDASDSKDSSYTWQETIGDFDFNLDRYENKEFCNFILNKIKEDKKLKKKDKDILDAYINIGNMSAVGRMFGVTRQQILHILVKIRKEVIINGWLYE